MLTSAAPAATVPRRPEHRKRHFHKSVEMQADVGLSGSCLPIPATIVWPVRGTSTAFTKA